MFIIYIMRCTGVKHPVDDVTSFLLSSRFQLLADDVPKESDESCNSNSNTGNELLQYSRVSSRERRYLTRCCESPVDPHSAFLLIGPGKELVHYMATPALTSEQINLEGGGADVPSLLELEAEPFFSTDLPTDTTAFLTPAQPDSDL